MKRLWMAMALSAMAAFGADISGNWKGSAEGPNGTIERSFVFHQDGQKLTGETNSERFGKSDIQDGKVEADRVSFHLTVNVGGTEGKVVYTGKVEGDTIHFTVEIEAVGQKLEMVAKRVSP